MTSFIETSHGRIALIDSRKKSESDYPSIIFLHGNCTNKSFFSEQMHSKLLLGYRLIFIDLPGHGESDRGINIRYVQEEVEYHSLWQHKIHIIPGSGHAVHWEKPLEFNTILKQFLHDILSKPKGQYVT